MPEGTKLVKTQAGHRCRLCDEVIPIGTTVPSYTGVNSEGWYTIYLHAECAAYTDKWHEDDWECTSPGDISHAEVKEILAEGNNG